MDSSKLKICFVADEVIGSKIRSYQMQGKGEIYSVISNLWSQSNRKYLTGNKYE